jgi:hypothetical protein
MRWNARMAWSAAVHITHALAVLALIFFVPGRASHYLTWAWGAAATFSTLGVLMLLRVGSYAGTTEQEVGQLIRRCYWSATVTYLGLLATSLVLIVRA